MDFAAVGTNLTRFEEVDRLSQQLPDVAAIDLVDDQDERIFAGVGRCIQKPPSTRFEAKTLVRWVRRKAHNEVLVGDCGMKLDRPPTILEEVPANSFGHSRLARS